MMEIKTLLLYLLTGLWNWNPESESLTVFTFQDKVGNQNQNHGYQNLEIRNMRLITKGGLRNESLIPSIDHYTLSKIKNVHFVLIYN